MTHEEALDETLQLGRKVAPRYEHPDQFPLDRVPNPHTSVLYFARFTCPELTSLCPVTGAPDFCNLVIDYQPKEWLVESKSLKLYLGAFRMHADFHEACTVGIGKRLVVLLDPHWLRVVGYWNPRGGIPIDVSAEWGEWRGPGVPLGLPDSMFRGR